MLINWSIVCVSTNVYLMGVHNNLFFIVFILEGLDESSWVVGFFVFYQIIAWYMHKNFLVWYQVVDKCMNASNPFDYVAFSLEIHK